MSGNARQRRLARRAQVRRLQAEAVASIGLPMRLVSAEYGRSYLGSLVTLLSVEGDEAQVKHRKRQSPLRVKLEHLKAA